MTDSQHPGTRPQHGGAQSTLPGKATLPAKGTLSKEAINELPAGSFPGRIEVIEGTAEAAAACDALRTGAAHGDTAVLGFDTESRPAFRRGERHPIALIQLASAGLACLFRIDPRLGPPPPLHDLLASRDVVKVAQGPADEVRELRDRWRVQARRVVDLVPIARADGCSPLSPRALAAAYLSIRISKGAQTSNWAAPRLSERQRRYAATDAWACREIFLAMGSPPAAELRLDGATPSDQGARRRRPRRRSASPPGAERRDTHGSGSGRATAAPARGG